MGKTILEKHNIGPGTLGLLCFINIGCASEYHENILKNWLFDPNTESGQTPYEILENYGFVEKIKGKKTDPDYKKVRLSDKGKEVLDQMFQKPQNPMSEFFLQTLKESYEKLGADKSYIKGGQKILKYISDFLYSRPTEYDETMIKAVIYAYTSQFESDLKYLRKMDTLIFKPQNVYSTKFNVESSPLHEFIQNNIELIRTYYGKFK